MVLEILRRENALSRHVVNAIYGVDTLGWSSNLPKKIEKFKLWAGIMKHKVLQLH